MINTIPTGIVSVNTFRSVTFRAGFLDNPAMVRDTEENLRRRRHQFNRLCELKDSLFDGNATAFGRKIGVQDTYAVRMFWPIGKSGRKGMGQDVEQRIRKVFCLQPGWFDLPLGTAIPQPGQDNTVQEPPRGHYAMATESEEETRLLKAYRNANADQRKMIMALAQQVEDSDPNPLPLTGTGPPA